MARRLVEEGVLATLVYDSALASVVRRADRVWIGAEALGARELTTRVGTRELLRVAREHDVPVDLVTTSDKLVPGGALELPRWCAKRPDLLWEDACEGVRLELDCFETVPLDLLPRPITELGRESLAELALRALLPDASPPCAALAREPS
jgi:translation initiation factor 2B subunit (eIF-2B alpha/beta/delta family)